MEYHVAKSGSDKNIGDINAPFLTINMAANIMKPGDAVIVHEGIYRESIKPKYKGLSDKRRITYKAAMGEKVIIKGSEHMDTWVRESKGIWKLTIEKAFFGDFNPYTEIIFGDWLVTDKEKKHLGDVYLNGMSFYEVCSYEELINPMVKEEVLDHWAKRMVSVLNPEQTKYVWFTESSDTHTTIYANFHEVNPNEEYVEINVRETCFYPETVGIDYITVKGFEMAQAATPWTPPTAEQPALIGANWSKGWIIEDNIIHDAKCSGISIGKERTTGHNDRSIRKDKPGYVYQLESVFLAEEAGWSKEKVGSHIIRNNTIYDCGQNAIVGHLGCVFSEIYNNHIYNIALKREFYGYEIAGIKLHAAIDVKIYHNRIHNCSLGLWLDWQTQGTRISKNLFYHNIRDAYVEVSHGPYIFDHNILASEYALDNHAQGGAYINNLIMGKMEQLKILDRATQYHFPHSTKVAGFSLVYGGDDRYFNNIFVGKENLNNVGTAQFNEYTASLEEYMQKVDDIGGDHHAFNAVEQPVYINNNVYLNGAKAFNREVNNYSYADFDPEISFIEKGEEVYLNCTLPQNFKELAGLTHSTNTLERVRIVDAEFESADGSILELNEDYFDKKKVEASPIGPINKLNKGKNYIKVW